MAVKDSLKQGLEIKCRYDIDRERTIDFMGDELRVYATPWMARDIEETCRQLTMEHLDDGEDTVGARIEVDHLGASLLGSWVEVTAKLVDRDGRRITFEAEVHDPLDQVGKARHVRFVIDTDRQKERLRAKARKLKDADQA